MANRDTINETLKIIGLSGFTGMAVVAPSASRALTRLLSKSSASHADTGRLLYDLKRMGLVEVAKEAGHIKFTLTPAGAYRLQELVVDEIRIPRPGKWDKKWRLVAFDIPVKQSRQRQLLVEKLQALHFVMLQKSLWAHPYPCFKQVQEIASHYNMLRYCSLLEISQADVASTRKLRQNFPGNL
ncbi:MAG: hypothetical protein Q7R60_02200 [bacterium]|nr:hypothetical protein [bacterium]